MFLSCNILSLSLRKLPIYCTVVEYIFILLKKKLFQFTYFTYSTENTCTTQTQLLVTIPQYIYVPQKGQHKNLAEDHKLTKVALHYFCQYNMIVIISICSWRHVEKEDQIFNLTIWDDLYHELPIENQGSREQEHSACNLSIEDEDINALNYHHWRQLWRARSCQHISLDSQLLPNTALYILAHIYYSHLGSKPL